MKTIEKTRLEPSDLVVIDGEVYRTDTRIHGKPCKDQCHLVDATGGCRGYCWRWDNADDIVFRHIISATLLSVQKLDDGEAFGTVGSADDFNDGYTEAGAEDDFDIFS